MRKCTNCNYRGINQLSIAVFTSAKCKNCGTKHVARGFYPLLMAFVSPFLFISALAISIKFSGEIAIVVGSLIVLVLLEFAISSILPLEKV